MTIYGYVRLSVREADEGSSLASQKAEIQRYADGKGEQVKFFIDDGYSGRSSKRPEYQRLRQSLATPGLSAVVCRSVDRLGRNLRETLDFVEEASQHGVAFVATSSGVDTSTANGLMFIQLMSVFAQAEAGAISERQTYSQEQRRSEGRSVGRTPYGYSVEQRPEGAFRVIKESEAQYIRQAVKLILDGSSSRSAAQAINESGATTVGGLIWTSQTLTKILRKPAICGLRQHLGEITTDPSGAPITDPHLAIVGIADWRELQGILDSRSWKRIKGSPKDQMLLAHIASCAGCGKGLIRDTYRGDPGRGKVNKYRCGTTGGCGNATSITETYLDKYILDQFNSMRHLQMTEVIETEDEATELQRESIELQVANIMEEMHSADASKISGLADRLSTLKQTQATLIPSVEYQVIETGETFGQVLDQDPRRLIKQAIERIVVTRPLKPNVAGNLEDRVTIHWRDSQQDFDAD